jgi:heme O synthase-like polyprenyltransferase
VIVGDPELVEHAPDVYGLARRLEADYRQAEVQLLPSAPFAFLTKKMIIAARAITGIAPMASPSWVQSNGEVTAPGNLVLWFSDGITTAMR